LKNIAAVLLLAFVRAAGAQESLPAGAGRSLVLESCVQCHDLRAIVVQRKSEPAWRRSVNEMIWRGAALKPGEADVVTRYLATSFGNDRPSPAAAQHPLPASRGESTLARLLPPGRGRALVLGACVQCHDLAVTVTQRKTLPEWRTSVEQMVRLGSKLNGDEIRVVSRYLASSFGTQ
jgi:mono/diheme cytochrome c family protein